MECNTIHWDHHHAFVKKLGLRALSERIPVNGSLELTSRCNFRCIHCYNGVPDNSKELGTDEWKDIIDQVAAAGTLFLLITGGEPLLRHDFIELYLYAVRKGLKITLFTNGSLINDEIIDVLLNFPPKSVEITLYGGSESTYRAITGRQDIFATCLKNIAKLQEKAIAVQMKTVFLKQNVTEFEKIKTIAENLGVRYRFDGAVFPRLDGNFDPLNHRLSPEQVAEMNLSSEELVTAWKKMAHLRQGIQLPDNMYSCGAAANCFHISARGMLQPCIMVDDIRFNMRNGSFTQGWEDVLPALWNKKMAHDHKCRDCKKQYFCDFCPAVFRLETGSENDVSQFLCEVGGLMAEKLRVSEHEEK